MYSDNFLSHSLSLYIFIYLNLLYIHMYVNLFMRGWGQPNQKPVEEEH